MPGQPNVYFGTGGDDRAPDDVRYRFYSVRDDEPAAACASESDLTKAKNETDLRFGDGDGNGATFEWVIGDGLKNTAWPPEAVSNAGEEGAAGDRYWSDPLIVGSQLIYFASLPGKIESVDPTVNIEGGESKLYCIAIRNLTDPKPVEAGESCWTSESAFERESVKIRKAMMVQGIPQEAWARDKKVDRSEPANLFSNASQTRKRRHRR